MMMQERLVRYLRNVHAPLDLIGFAGRLVEEEKKRRRAEKDEAELEYKYAVPPCASFDPMWEH